MCNLSSLSFSVVVITLLYEEKICHLNMLVCVAQKKKNACMCIHYYANTECCTTGSHRSKIYIIVKNFFTSTILSWNHLNKYSQINIDLNAYTPS